MTVENKYANAFFQPPLGIESTPYNMVGRYAFWYKEKPKKYVQQHGKKLHFIYLPGLLLMGKGPLKTRIYDDMLYVAFPDIVYVSRPMVRWMFTFLWAFFTALIQRLARRV